MLMSPIVYPAARSGNPARSPPFIPFARSIHVAIISDGNGRWATSRGLPRSAGHRAGAQTARAVIEAAPRLGIHTLTLFALSSANWKRPPAEVTAILRILHEYLLTETSHCIDQGIRLSIIGRRDRIPATLRQAIARFRSRHRPRDSPAPAPGRRLFRARSHLSTPLAASTKSPNSPRNLSAPSLSEVLRGGSTEVDLLIRTGGEQRLSDFLLWECAFAEFVFLSKRWPDFTVDDSKPPSTNSATASVPAAHCPTPSPDNCGSTDAPICARVKTLDLLRRQPSWPRAAS